MACGPTLVSLVARQVQACEGLSLTWPPSLCGQEEGSWVSTG